MLRYFRLLDIFDILVKFIEPLRLLFALYA